MSRRAMTRSQFAAHLEKEINASELPQSELAHRLGYSNANVITMFKNSTTRLPLEKVAPMARALHLDSGELLRAWPVGVRRSRACISIVKPHGAPHRCSMSPAFAYRSGDHGARQGSQSDLST
jgi:hypothetical protein